MTAEVRVGAVSRGAFVGLVGLVGVSLLRVLADRTVDDFGDSAWAPLFAFAILAIYVVAGAVAGTRAPDTPLTNGALAGIGALALWVPLRVLIWAVRDEGVGLVTGDDAAFTVVQLFGQLVFGAALGMLGGLVGARMRQS